MNTRDGPESARCAACGGPSTELTERRGEATACATCASGMLVRSDRTPAFAPDPNPNGGVAIVEPTGRLSLVVKPFPVGWWLAGNLFAGTVFCVIGWIGKPSASFLYWGIAWIALALLCFAWLRRQARKVTYIDLQRSAFRMEVNGHVALDIPFHAVRQVCVGEAGGTSDDVVKRDVWIVLPSRSISVARLDRELAERFAPEIARIIGAPRAATPT